MLFIGKAYQMNPSKGLEWTHYMSGCYEGYDENKKTLDQEGHTYNIEDLYASQDFIYKKPVEGFKIYQKGEGIESEAINKCDAAMHSHNSKHKN